MQWALSIATGQTATTFPHSSLEAAAVGNQRRIHIWDNMGDTRKITVTLDDFGDTPHTVEMAMEIISIMSHSPSTSQVVSPSSISQSLCSCRESFWSKAVDGVAPHLLEGTPMVATPAEEETSNLAPLFFRMENDTSSASSCVESDSESSSSAFDHMPPEETKAVIVARMAEAYKTLQSMHDLRVKQPCPTQQKLSRKPYAQQLETVNHRLMVLKEKVGSISTHISEATPSTSVAQCPPSEDVETSLWALPMRCNASCRNTMDLRRWAAGVGVDLAKIHDIWVTGSDTVLLLASPAYLESLLKTVNSSRRSSFQLVSARKRRLRPATWVSPRSRLINKQRPRAIRSPMRASKCNAV
ncbi:MAG: hypothetical protein KVP17_001675 [Porospora cf. gigantea B]|uniref:uncharacterized protein n=1 Tax=Porospora cf. gigantea B TaxID=2853592 RepID=UPI003571B9E4|nr:MAG: hypothetical protein KVP17_001675 [Porospora cf. gigantea B]